MFCKLMKFVANDNTIDGVLSQFQILKERLIEIANRSSNRVREIDTMIDALEAEGMQERANEERALKVAENISEVFKV